MTLAPAIIIRRGRISTACRRHRLGGLLARALAISLVAIVPVAILRDAATRLLDEWTAETREDTAWATAAKLAYGVYPSWRPLHRDAACPAIDALTPAPLDPWGARYQLACLDRDGRPDAIVWSRGPDGLAGTEDDIWSDR